MYSWATLIWWNSSSTAPLVPAETLPSRLISVVRPSISSSFKDLKISAEISAPRLTSRMAAFRWPLRVSSASRGGASVAVGMGAPLGGLGRDPGPDQLGHLLRVLAGQRLHAGLKFLPLPDL